MATDIFPSDRILVCAHYEDAHLLKQCCEQLNIAYTWDEEDDTGDWCVCSTYCSPEQHTLLNLMLPYGGEWYAQDFEEALHEQFEIIEEHKLANPELYRRTLEQIKQSSQKLKDFLEGLD